MDYFPRLGDVVRVWNGHGPAGFWSVGGTAELRDERAASAEGADKLQGGKLQR